jgi:hypothetical protein
MAEETEIASVEGATIEFEEPGSQPTLPPVQLPMFPEVGDKVNEVVETVAPLLIDIPKPDDQLPPSEPAPLAEPTPAPSAEVPPDMPPEVQVAGRAELGEKLIGFFKKMKKKKEKIEATVNETDLPEGVVRDYLIIEPTKKPLVEAVSTREAEEFLVAPRAEELPGAQPSLPGIARDEPGIKFAANINLHRITGEDDIKEVIRITADMANQHKDVRGFQSRKETEKLANELGISVEKLISGELFQNVDLKELPGIIVASRKVLATSADNILALARSVTENPGPKEVVAFRKAMGIHNAIQSQVSGATADIGRSIGSFNIDVKTRAEFFEQINRISELVGGVADNQQMAKAIVEAAEIGELNMTLINRMSKITTGARDVFLELWINGLLSGPPTQMVNITSNLLVAIWQVPERMVAGAIGAVHRTVTGSEGGVRIFEAVSQAYGMMRGLGEGLILAGKTIRTGESQLGLTKIDMPRVGAIKNALQLAVKKVSPNDYVENWGVAAANLMAAVLTTPGRLLLAGDDLFKSIGYRGQLHARAYRDAAENGLRGVTAAQHMNKIIENPPRGIHIDSVNVAEYQTFTKELGLIGKLGMSAVNIAPFPLRFIFPFIRTPVNIMKFAGERAGPAALLSRKIRGTIARGMSPKANSKQKAAAHLALSRMALGGFVGYQAFSWAQQGLITGGGPGDPVLRSLWLIDHQPYSIKFGDTWYAYGRLEPLGTILGVGADIAEISGHLAPEEFEEIVTAYVAAAGRNVTSKTFLRGLSDLTKTLADPGRYAEHYVEALAGTLIPSVSAQLARSGLDVGFGLMDLEVIQADPVMRDVASVLDKLKSRVPGWGDLAANRNIFGHKVLLEGGLGPDLVSPVYTKKDTGHPVAKVVVDNKIRLTKPSRVISQSVTALTEITIPGPRGEELPLPSAKTEMLPHEYDRYMELYGHALKTVDFPEGLEEFMKKLVKSKDFLALSDGAEGGKSILLRAMYQDMRTLMTDIVMGDPEALAEAASVMGEEEILAIVETFLPVRERVKAEVNRILTETVGPQGKN